MRKLSAEFVGTFALVFAGTGAVSVNDVSRGTVPHVGVGLTFGLVVLARPCCRAVHHGLQP
jgi:aquaporin NIP